MSFELSGSTDAVIDSDENRGSISISRRNLILGAVGIGAGILGINKLGPTASENKIIEAPKDYSISADEAEATISSLTQDRDIYVGDRSEINPELLQMMSPQGLENISKMRITDKNRTNEGFGKDFAVGVNRYVVAGLTTWDALKARENMPVGERDNLGNSLCDYSEYVHETYGQHMEKGLLDRFHGQLDSIESIEVLRKYRNIVSRGFERDLSPTLVGEDTEPTANATAYVSVDSVKELPTVPGFDRHLLIAMNSTSTSREFGDIRHWMKADVYVKDREDGSYGTVFEKFSFGVGDNSEANSQ